MKVNQDKKYIPLKEVGKITGYASDYIGYLIRKRKIKGRKVYTNASWVITPEEIIKYCQKRKNLEVRDSSLLNKKYLSLKEAAKISGYSPDYIGWLIRAGKIAGRKIYAGISWQTTEEAIENYRRRKTKSQENLLFNLPSYLKLHLIPQRGNKVFGFGWRLALAVIIIFFLASGFAPLRFFQSSIVAITGPETKTVSFYNNQCIGDWKLPQNAEGSPNVGPGGDINSFSEANSAIYKTGPLILLCQDFKQLETITQEQVEEVTSTPEIIVEEATSTEEQQTTSTLPEATTTESTSTEATTTEATTTPGVMEEEATSTPPIQEEEATSTETTTTEATGEEISVGTTTTGVTSTEPESEPTSFFEKTKRFFGFRAYAQENTFSAKIKFSFAIGEKESDIIIEQPATATESESITSPPTSFWQKVKSFFGSLVIRVASIAKAEEEPVNPTENIEATFVQTQESSIDEEESVTTEIEATTTETTTEAITETLPNLDARIIIWWSLDGINWQQLVTLSDYPLSNFLNGGYFEYDAPFLKNWDDIKNLKIKFEGVVGGESNVTAYLDSVWVEVEYQ